MKHVSTLLFDGKTAEEPSKSTFHHKIALFCTVAANLCSENLFQTIFYNEIKELERFFETFLSQKTFKIKHLASALKVML